MTTCVSPQAIEYELGGGQDGPGGGLRSFFGRVCFALVDFPCLPVGLSVVGKGDLLSIASYTNSGSCVGASRAVPAPPSKTACQWIKPATSTSGLK